MPVLLLTCALLWLHCCQVELLSWSSVKDIAGDGGVIKTIVAEGEGW
jgi:hypothetical protein